MTPWYERSGGYLVALFIHILLISWLLTVLSTQPEEAEASIQIALSFSEESAAAAAAPAEEAAEESPVTPPDDRAAATGAEEAMTQELLELVELLDPSAQPEEPEESAEVQEPIPEPDIIETPAPDPAPTEQELEEERLREIERRKEQAWQEYIQMERNSRTAASLEQAIQADEVALKGRDLLDESTYGAETGAVRTFEFKGNDAVIRDIMARYEMRYVTKYMNEQELVHSGYLNRMESDRGNYYAANKAGIYDMFEIGPAGMAKLRRLEVEALKANGFNPNTDRVVLIKFGIVRTEHGWDLGVIDFKGEEVF